MWYEQSTVWLQFYFEQRFSRVYHTGKLDNGTKDLVVTSTVTMTLFYENTPLLKALLTD